MSDLIRLSDVSFSYPAHKVFSGVDFSLSSGERVALIGANGSGKSTLLQLMVGLCKPSSGSVYAFGGERVSEADFQEVRSKVGLLFQDSDDQLFCPTVLEDVAFGPLNLGKTPAEAREITEQVLSSLGLSGFSQRITHRLSGGEKRMVALAAVLAMQPRVLLLDEPTAGLDEVSEKRLLRYLESLHMAMVFVSHDRRLVEQLATRAVLMQDATLVEGVIHSHPHLHTHAHMHIHAVGIDAGHEHNDKPPKHEHPHED